MQLFRFSPGASRPRRRLLIALPLLLIGLASSFGARASVTPELDLRGLTTNADRIVVGDVVSVKSAWESGRKRIFTNIEVKVTETWKGPTPEGGKIIIQQPGGQVGDIEMRVFGLAEFHEGQKAVLFLTGTEKASAVVGLGQGMRPVSYDSKSARWMVQPADRSAAVTTDKQGRLGGPSAPDEIVPLETLRARVRKLVQP
jgi:hypothetical protein